MEGKSPKITLSKLLLTLNMFRSFMTPKKPNGKDQIYRSNKCITSIHAVGIPSLADIIPFENIGQVFYVHHPQSRQPNQAEYPATANSLSLISISAAFCLCRYVVPNANIITAEQNSVDILHL